MWLPVMAATANPGAAGRGASTARPCRCRGHHVHWNPLVSRNELTRDSAGHACVAAPRDAARARYRTARRADCTDNAAASCTARHRSADRYSNRRPTTPHHRVREAQMPSACGQHPVQALAAGTAGPSVRDCAEV
jgi:hypothetical protein